MKICQTIHEVLAPIQSNMTVFVHGAAATPTTILKALTLEAARLNNVELIHLHTEGEAPYARAEFHESFRVTSLFVGKNLRGKLDYDRIDYLPCFLSEIPQLFRKGIKPIDVALIQVSHPDPHGFVSLGVSVDIAKAAVESAKIVIAQFNSCMPRVLGDGLLHVSKIHFAFELNEPIYSPHPKSLTEIELQIGKNVAELVEDGATIQLGIGAIPDAVCSYLKGHRNLGLHSEMWTDGALNLIQSGVINNSQKKFHQGKSTAAFIIGSPALYQFANDNVSVLNFESSYINYPINIIRNPKVTAINSAVEIDLTGQVCADSVGKEIISGVGGQMDFIRAAALSEGGKPILALPSTTSKGISRIVSQLKPGAGVVTTRSHIHYVVTEYGVVNLFGKTLSQRALALINIAHPDHRNQLEKDWLIFQKKQRV
jgi:4-hydroxybutyrate CoA-transferase